ncbi:hypothetical protein VYU27_000787 [Nannochloropsis oceanica]
MSDAALPNVGPLMAAARLQRCIPKLLLLLLLELVVIARAFMPCPILLANVPHASACMALQATPFYRLTRHALTQSDRATITISIADGRTFVLQDTCPPTNHSLLHAEVDPAILSVQDPVFGTRFDLRTGRLRGAWCPNSWWVRRLFKPADLVLLSSSAILAGEK